MTRSAQLFERGKMCIPGAVNSPVRAWKNVGGTPLFIERGSGPFVFDVDGKKYIDYVLSWGPLILGHAAPAVTEAILGAVKKGSSFGAPTEAEVQFAELICKTMPSLEMLRLVSSGTEATMSAIRLARAHTKKNVIIKCNGCYHGHADSLLVKAGSGVATFGIAGSPGVPEELAALTVCIEFNDADLLETTVKKIGKDKIAAFIVEPIPGNMGLVLPKTGYLASVREICSQNDIILIFDEVMCGYRVSLGGAQERFKVVPDLTTLGKVIGGGMPLAAFGGRREIMEKLAPSGPVYQAGTLSGNPVAVAAGLKTLEILIQENPYLTFEKRANQWVDGMNKAAMDSGIPFKALSCGSMIGFFFSADPISSFNDALRTDAEKFRQFFHGMIEQGISLAPSAFEAGFLSTEHNEEIIDATICAARQVFSSLD